MFVVFAYLLAVAQGGQLAPHRLQSARFFYEPESSSLLKAVRENMEKGITFNGHFSQAYVSCGPGCSTYFFVDRMTGGVVTAPEGNPPREVTWEVAAKRDSSVIKVTFGPMDGVGPVCSEQHFRLAGHRFVAVDKRAAVRCPT